MRQIEQTSGPSAASRAGRLLGQRCLIVGGTSGIGLATARRFLEEGARVVVSGKTPQERDGALELLKRYGPVQAIAADVTQPDAVSALYSAALEFLDGRLDVLFHVAGISGRRFGDGPLDECSTAGWDAVLETNAKGVFLTNQAAVRRMRAQPLDNFGLRGTVLNMGSVLAWSPSPDDFGTYAYAASKGAVHAMTLAAAARYARDRIRFNLLAPGLIDTPMATRAVGNPSIRAYLATKQPIAGGPGTPEDCAEGALYLCEPASRLVTATVLTIDGGWCVSEGQRPNPLSPGTT
jgi:NAD(P)-dependent dehydrogenase (short-subunit alcohol dehydrogenase family)